MRIAHLCLLITTFVQVPADPKADAARKERDKHQGVWNVVSFVSDGVASGPELVKSVTRIVEGDHVVWKRDGESFAGTTVTLDAAARPPAIDVLPDGGPRRDEQVLGIYKLEGDDLTICMAAPGKDRPKELTGAKGTGQTLMTFRRAPK